MQKSKKKKLKIISAISFIVVFAGLLVFLFSGDNFIILKNIFSEGLTKEELREHLSGFGYKGVITIGLLSMLQVVFTFLPAEPVQVMAGISFGFLNGTLICLGGVIIGNTIIYIMYKIYGDKLDEFFDKNIDIDLETASHSNKTSLIIFVLYFLPAIPYGLICFFAATLKLKYPHYILLTTCGAIPSICIGVGLGHVAIASSWIISIIVLLVLIALLVVLFRNKAKVFAKVNEFLKKNRKTYNSETKVQKQNPFIYNIIFLGLKIFYAHKFKVTVKKSIKDIEKPSIVLCTHGSFIDFVYSGFVLKKYNPHYVSARLYFYHKKLAWLLKKLGAFPKSMFSTDIENARNFMKVIDMNRVITMMPEARLSTVGKFEGIQDETIKFIMRMGVPVYILRINGSYLANPKWGDKLRKGSLIDVSLDKLYTGEEISNASLEEVKFKIFNALEYNDFKWLESHPEVKYKSKTLAVGLHNILTRCPSCGKHYTFTTQNRSIKCENCNFELTLDDRYNFNENKHFANFQDWYSWQTEEYRKEILADENFELKQKVQLKHSSYDGKSLLRHSGYGECILNKDGLTYRGEEDGETVEKFFPLKNIYRLLFGAGEDFEIYEGRQIYFFVPEERRSCVDWYIVSGLLKEIYDRG